MYKSASHYRGRARKRRRARKIAKTLLAVFALLLFSSGLIFLSRANTFLVDTVTVSGAETIKNEDIQAAVLESIDGRFLYFIPRSNVALVQTDKLEEELRSQFKRIEEIEVDRSGLKELSVEIVEREPFGLWCASENDCYFLDIEGLIFAPASFVSSSVFLVFDGGIDGPAVGQSYLSSSDFEKLSRFIDGVRSLGFVPRRVSQSQSADFTITLDNGARLIIDLGSDLEKTFANFQSVISDRELGLTEGGKIIAGYIDLRFGDKVFYHD